VLKFANLQQTLANLRFPDKDFLRTGRLAPLAKSFDAYPVIEGSRRLCVLVPRGSDPQSLGRLSEGQAQAKVVVLEQGAGGGAWAKIWPSAAPEAAEPAPVEAEKPEPAPDAGNDIEYVED
jgi:hypothetical protein